MLDLLTAETKASTPNGELGRTRLADSCPDRLWYQDVWQPRNHSSGHCVETPNSPPNDAILLWRVWCRERPLNWCDQLSASMRQWLRPATCSIDYLQRELIQAPCERFLGRWLFYGHLIGSGTSAQVLSTSARAQKSGSTSVPGYLVGYTRIRNTYRIWLENTKRVLEISDVIFCPRSARTKMNSQRAEEYVILPQSSQVRYETRNTTEPSSLIEELDSGSGPRQSAQTNSQGSYASKVWQSPAKSDVISSLSGGTISAYFVFMQEEECVSTSMRSYCGNNE